MLLQRRRGEVTSSLSASQVLSGSVGYCQSATKIEKWEKWLDAIRKVFSVCNCQVIRTV